MIWASVNRLFFIKISSSIKPEKILLLKPLIPGEDYRMNSCAAKTVSSKDFIV
jgi:hypothetical protein